MICTRKGLDYVFTQRELKILDDVMPEQTRRNHEEELKKKEELDEVEVLFHFNLRPKLVEFKGQQVVG